MRRDTHTRPLFSSCEWVVVVVVVVDNSQEGWRRRKTQSTLCCCCCCRTYRCRAGRVERIRPYLNGSLSLSRFFPLLLSPLCSPLPNNIHALTSYTTPSHPLPDFIIFLGFFLSFSREYVAIFSRIKTNTYVIIRDSSCVIYHRRLFLPPPLCPIQHLNIYQDAHPSENPWPILDGSPDIRERGDRPAGCREKGSRGVKLHDHHLSGISHWIERENKDIGNMRDFLNRGCRMHHWFSHF